MFVNAIEIVGQFTRPIHTISRFYGSDLIHPGAATLFFVNSEGWALTCRHVVELIIAGNNIYSTYQSFLNERKEMRGKKKDKQIKRELETKYKYSKTSLVDLQNRFFNCIEGNFNINSRVQLLYVGAFSMLKWDQFES